jgi:hypothetical protein
MEASQKHETALYQRLAYSSSDYVRVLLLKVTV